MVLDSLGSSLQGALDKLSGKRGSLSKDDIDPIIKEIQKALLEGDVQVELVQEVSDNIEDRALNTEPPGGVTAREHVLKIVYEELTDIVGESTEIPLKGQTILLAGLQGAGKTTTSAKMGWWFEKKGLRSSLIQTDTQRPGAHKQTKQLAEEGELLYSVDSDADDAVERAEQGLEEVSEADVKIVDTAGRHASEEALINEIKNISDKINPDLNILVLDAAMGQSAEEQARKFDDAIGIDGVVITKMDGTAKGGGSLTAVRESDSTIAFLGTGEGVRDIERFDPDGFISRLLGMGDLQQLSERVERAMYEMDDDDWEPEDALEGEFTLYDMKKQMEAMDNMGRIQDIVKRIPGMGSSMLGELDDDILESQEDMMNQFSIIMDSMTEKEMQKPEIVDDERKRRIARGSGTSEDDIEEMLAQYNQMKGFFDQIGGADDLQKMAKQFGGGGGGLGGFGPF